MKCLSLWQPWATLIAIGAKRVETRCWATNYRGPVAIHAAKHYSMETAAFASTGDCHHALHAAGESWGKLPRGAIVAICQLEEVLSTSLDFDTVAALPDAERYFGNYAPGRFMWVLGAVQRLKTPIPFRAHQGLFNLDASTIKAIQEAAR